MNGNWHRGVVDAADRFTTRWHRGGAEKSWLRHAAEDAKRRNKGEPGEPDGGGQPNLYRCRRMQKRHGSSCGKVPVQSVSGACATSVS